MATGISPEIYGHLRELLLSCKQFNRYEDLKAIFVDARLSPWYHDVRDGESAFERVNLMIDFLSQRFNSDTSENALVLLLRALSDQIDVHDSRNQELGILADELEHKLIRLPTRFTDIATETLEIEMEPLGKKAKASEIEMRELIRLHCENWQYALTSQDVEYLEQTTTQRGFEQSVDAFQVVKTEMKEREVRLIKFADIKMFNWKELSENQGEIVVDELWEEHYKDGRQEKSIYRNKYQLVFVNDEWLIDFYRPLKPVLEESVSPEGSSL